MENFIFCAVRIIRILFQILLREHIMKGNPFNGYLRYKTVAFQIVSSEAQVKNLFHRKVRFQSQDIQVFVFLIMP